MANKKKQGTRECRTQHHSCVMKEGWKKNLRRQFESLRRATTNCILRIFFSCSHQKTIFRTQTSWFQTITGRTPNCVVAGHLEIWGDSLKAYVERQLIVSSEIRLRPFFVTHAWYFWRTCTNMVISGSMSQSEGGFLKRPKTVKKFWGVQTEHRDMYLGVASSDFATPSPNG